MEQFKKSKYFLEESYLGTIALFVSDGEKGYSITIGEAFIKGKFYISISSFMLKVASFDSTDLVADGKEWVEESRYRENGYMLLNDLSSEGINKMLEDDPFKWVTDVRKGANDVLREYFNKVVL